MNFLRMSAKRNILRSYRRFKQTMLCADKKTIWDHSEKISFINGVVDYFLHNETIPEVFYQMAVSDPDLLNLMYQVYKSDQKLFYHTLADFDKVLEQVLINWGTCAA